MIGIFKQTEFCKHGDKWGATSEKKQYQTSKISKLQNELNASLLRETKTKEVGKISNVTNKNVAILVQTCNGNRIIYEDNGTINQSTISACSRRYTKKLVSTC